MKRFQVRFHLGAGEHFGHWQIKGPGGVQYRDPAACDLLLLDCQLRNHRGTAERIHAGDHKKVCAWIDCSEVIVTVPGPKPVGLSIHYDPRVAPHWRNFRGADCDNIATTVIRSSGKSLFVTGERTETVHGLVRLAAPADEAAEHRRLQRMRSER